ncbi:hypothetical protein PI124_g17055 [Phytophthora idaei]|nr:hypothetical protein PI125_g21429 [Phytophthora idaei]KAG3151414.1 hypothetical protein PI126_g11022 [Phytophthora idaei]KAG3237967.1 hypothetical protein PI124_g17055 [Phytophthora idaei]
MYGGFVTTVMCDETQTYEVSSMVAVTSAENHFGGRPGFVSRFER